MDDPNVNEDRRDKTPPVALGHQQANIRPPADEVGASHSADQLKQVLTSEVALRDEHQQKYAKVDRQNGI